ncbi:MAG TPA: hypothetical protein VIS05_08320 [Ilumatobacter sp.]
MAVPLRQIAVHPDRRGNPLRVVARRSRAARFAIALVVLLSGVMMGVVFLHTRIAERQLELDRLERAVHDSQAQFDILRADRAELRSPTRLSALAGEMGMRAGDESVFVRIDPMLLAVTIARTGEMPNRGEIVPGSTARLGPLDQFRLVKKVGAEAP